MNRSILIVICDFLLVSLLAFSTVDINKATDEGVERRVKVDLATNQVASGQEDLAAVMRLALEEERKGRDQLLRELARTRESAGEREKQAQTFQQQLQAREQETLRLQQQQTNLEQQFAAAQTNIQNLNQQVEISSADALISKEKLAAMEAELRKHNWPNSRAATRSSWARSSSWPANCKWPKLRHAPPPNKPPGCRKR